METQLLSSTPKMFVTSSMQQWIVNMYMTTIRQYVGGNCLCKQWTIWTDLGGKLWYCSWSNIEPIFWNCSIVKLRWITYNHNVLKYSNKDIVQNGSLLTDKHIGLAHNLLKLWSNSKLLDTCSSSSSAAILMGSSPNGNPPLFSAIYLKKFDIYCTFCHCHS